MSPCYGFGMERNSRRTVSQDLLEADSIDAILDALGDRTRRTIFRRLSEGPKAVVEVARGLPVSRPAVSQHLKVLKNAGLVTDREDGTRRLYTVNPEGVAALRAYLDRFWNVALVSFKQAVERTEGGS